MSHLTPSVIVNIHTHCPYPRLSRGVVDAIQSWRVGFPDSRMEIFDQESHPDALSEIRAAADAAGAEFSARPAAAPGEAAPERSAFLAVTLREATQ